MIQFHCLNNIPLRCNTSLLANKCGSEVEPVLLECDHDVWLQVALALLSHPVSVEGGGLSAEEVGLVLEVVVF